MMASREERVVGSVIACGRRILAGSSRDEWTDDTRKLISRALLDQAFGMAALNAKIEAGRASWRDRESFRAWLERLVPCL